ncbi:hypothetical protein H4R35_001244, partial [Dimargaris xerosporica]
WRTTSTSAPSAADGTAAKRAPLPPNAFVPQPEFPVANPSGNILQRVQREGIQRMEDGRRAELVLRRPKDPQRTIQPGDIILVESVNSKTSNTTTRFVGICLGVFRRGVDTSFTLRNIVMKVGVEVNFKVYSPMIKGIQILQKGTGYRRAKLTYLRQQPEKAQFFNDPKYARLSQ